MSTASDPVPSSAARLHTRSVDRMAELRLRDAGFDPLLARLLAARGVRGPDDYPLTLDRLLPPDGLRGIGDAAGLLVDAIHAEAPIVIVGDYDCDGATAIAVGVLGLRAMGATVDYLVPNRSVHGYGLTPEIAELAAAHPRLGAPELLVTVDNGIAAHAGIERAHELGMAVLVTDHHLPGDTLPDADAIVNPNQPGCSFPSKCIAGVGVMFYLLSAVRAQLRASGWFSERGEHGERDEHRPMPNLGQLLDLVALGTVADVVPLDANNRILVGAGLKRIRSGQCRPGILALLEVAGRDPRSLHSTDLGFVLGPRLNAAGRLEDMSIGIECLLAPDLVRALPLAHELDRMNRERRDIESDMRRQAEEQVVGLAQADAALDTAAGTHGNGGERHGYVVHDRGWHHGVVGLVASKIKDARHRPCVALAPEQAGDPASHWRGSGRSIAGVHLRDVLDRIDRQHPGLMLRFGGHAMAAGFTLRADGIDTFASAFDAAVAAAADPECFVPGVLTDGPLSEDEMKVEVQQMLDDHVWGQAFAPPLFSGRFRVLSQRLIKDRHLKLSLVPDEVTRSAPNRQGPQSKVPPLSAIAFNTAGPFPDRALLAYRMQRDEYQGRVRLSLVIEKLLES